MGMSHARHIYGIEFYGSRSGYAKNALYVVPNPLSLHQNMVLLRIWRDEDTLLDIVIAAKRVIEFQG
jgi:hypothetical protein